MASNLYARKIKALLYAIDEDREQVDQVLRNDFTEDELMTFWGEVGSLYTYIDDMIVEKRSEKRNDQTH